MKNSSLILLLILAFALLGEACKQKSSSNGVTAAVTYTCPMHPQIIESQPGTCPICGMDLVVFDRSDSTKMVILDSTQRILANVTTMVVGDTSVSSHRVLNARVITNPGNTHVIASRVAGRIEFLTTKETGVKINKGELLYRVYSEELEALQQEYLVAAAQHQEFPGDEQFSRIEKTARQRLLLFGQTNDQVTKLLKSKQPNPVANYYSTVNGIVAEVIASEGGYVAEGGPIIRLEQYEDVWIEADVYPSERQNVSTGMSVPVFVSGSREPETMKIDFISPDYQPGSQITTIRGRLATNGSNLVPGMRVEVHLAEKGENAATIVPLESVIRDSKGSHVWVETLANRFEPRVVVTGKENDRQAEIVSGISNGDRVVVTGAYLLYSEYVLKKGSEPVGQNHQH